MNRSIPILILTALSAVVFADESMASQQTDRVLKETEVRQKQMLTSMLQAPYPPRGSSGGPSLWHYEDFAMAAYWLNQKTDEADAGILTLQKDLYPAAIAHFDAGAFHWHAYLQQRLYFLFSRRSKHFPGRMGLAAENAILKMQWEWAGPVCRKELADPKKVWWAWGSENHHLMAWVSFWGAAQIFKDHPDYKNRKYADGSTPAEMAAAFDEYFKAYASERASKGLLWEIAAPTYAKYSLNTWYNLADFADDPVLKKRMDMLLNVYWADWAIEQINGVRGGSRHRCYTGRAAAEQSGGAGSAWYHFGVGTKANKHPGTICAATTFWRPAPLVVALAIDTKGRGEYSSVSRRPGLKESQDLVNFVADPSHPLYKARGLNHLHPQGGSLLRTTWSTPDFVAGMSQVAPLAREVWCAGSSQNRWNGVIFAGHPTARIFTQRPKPKRGSVYNAEWGVQDRGVMILQRLRASNAKGQMIWFDSSLKRHEKDGWIFTEAPQAYAAVRVAKGGGDWKPDSIKQRRDGKGGEGLGEWFVLRDEYAPIIIECIRKKDCSGLAAFQKAILANPLSWKGNIVRYRSSFYKTTLTLPVDAGGPPLINGTPVDYEPKEVYKSPYLNAGFGDGVVTIQKEGRTLTLDFTQE